MDGVTAWMEDKHFTHQIIHSELRQIINRALHLPSKLSSMVITDILVQEGAYKSACALYKLLLIL